MADFRPAEYATGKIKKVDGQDRAGRPGAQPRHPGRALSHTGPAVAQVVVGFAAETDDVLGHGRPSWRARAATSWSSTKWAAVSFRQDTMRRFC
ncbi:hypothetical protein GCM10020229_27490 [Kitasatospora albolonga]|uniref:phosphopantothenoylcysteine decarboxylase domain-containing protein n=1 Tax=Kitasatospora albolonga TaxID=68173 RepID=UPI00336C5549